MLHDGSCSTWGDPKQALPPPCPIPHSHRLNICADGKRIVAARFELVVPFFQKTPEGFLDEGSSSRRSDRQLSALETPLKLPNKLTGNDFTLEGAVLPGLLSHSDVSCGFRQALRTHPFTSATVRLLYKLIAFSTPCLRLNSTASTASCSTSDISCVSDWENFPRT